MAYPKPKRQLIEFLEDAVATAYYVQGYLETRIDADDKVAGRCSTMLESLKCNAVIVRSAYFEQGKLFEGEDGDDG